MSVYVDNLRPCQPKRVWRWCTSCHLIADSPVELHEFAARLGLQRSWFQAFGRLPHYDLTAGKRRRALALGAHQISDRALVARMDRRGSG